MSPAEQSPRPAGSVGSATRSRPRAGPHLRSRPRQPRGVTPRASVSTPGAAAPAPEASPGSTAHRGTSGQGFPESGRRGRGCRTWPQTGGGEGCPPGPAWGCFSCSLPRLPVLPPPARRPQRCRGPERKRGVRDKVRLPQRGLAGRCHAAVPVTTQQPPRLLRSSRPPEQDRVPPADALGATHVVTPRPPLSPGAAAQDPAAQMSPALDRAVASGSCALSSAPARLRLRLRRASARAPGEAVLAQRRRASAAPAPPPPACVLLRLLRLSLRPTPPATRTAPASAPLLPAEPLPSLQRRQPLGSGRPRPGGLGGPSPGLPRYRQPTSSCERVRRGLWGWG